MRLMFVNMILRRGFRDLPTFASAVVRGLFVDWPMLRAKSAKPTAYVAPERWGV